MDELTMFTCPHCGNLFGMTPAEFNCKILRHFVFFNFSQLDPHAPREECERVVAQNLGYGCAGPIEIVANSNGGWTAAACEYK